MQSDLPLDRQKLRQRSATISLLVSLLILILKFAAYSITGSVAVLTDATESIINVVATAFALFTIIMAARPADDSHPYGHGKIDYFSMGFEGALISVAALLMLLRSLQHLFFPVPLQSLGLGMLLVGAGGLANGLLALYLLRRGRQTDSLVLIADGKHILTDAITSFALVIGLALMQWSGWRYFDPLLGILLASHLLYVGTHLVRGAAAGLMDAASPTLLADISTSLNRHREPAMIDVHYLRSRRSGDTHHIDFHLIVPRYWDLEKVHDEVHKIENWLLQTLGVGGEVHIHAEPCADDYCNSCAMPSCPIRKQACQSVRPINAQTMVDRRLK